MAIIPLKKVSVYCMKADVENVMHALQERGVLHVASVQPEAGLGKYLEGERDQATLDRIVFALDVIKKYDTSKTPFLSAKPEITRDEFRALKDKSDIIDKAYAAAKEMEDSLSSIRSEIQKKQNQKAMLEPFSSLDMPLAFLRGTKTADVFLGYLPKETAEKTRIELDEYPGPVYAGFLAETGQTVPALLIVHRSCSAKLREIIKANGFSDARLEGFEHTAKEHIEDLAREMEDLTRGRDEILSGAGDMVQYKTELLALEDYHRSCMQRQRELCRIASTQSAALIEGYVKHYEQDKLDEAVSLVSKAYYIEAADPADDDKELPTAVENNAVVAPFEAVTDMYSVPGPRTFDANALMMPFYFIFFGMMLSDAAYGIILSVGSILFLKIKKPEGTFKKILMVLAICGVSTVIWGSGFGSWMGFGLNPWLFDPLKNPLNMLILCIALGIVHLLAGLGMGAYINIKRRRYSAAVFDQGFWILILASIPFFVLPGAGTAGLVMLAAGAVGIVATAGRHNKGIVKKIMGGLSGLYGITGYLSDILSYARLFGMALATSVIAMVFNTIAGMMAGSLAGIPFAIVIFLIGHVFNIGINSLGAFVHSARLQYIEFFSKFYEGGGMPFNPLRIKLKNMRMVK